MDWCEYCSESEPAFRGIHFPADHPDREESRDGKVWIARCGECYDPSTNQGYDNDVEAADAITVATGWPWHKSYDRDDSTDPTERNSGSNFFRPYFDVSLVDVENLMFGKLLVSNGRFVKPDKCQCGAYKTSHAVKGDPAHSSWCPWARP